MIDAGVPVALASDFNPNAHCLDMPTTMNLACVTLGMTMEEALVASTINAAAALGVGDSHGSLEVGKLGDCVLLDAPSWQHVIYQLHPPLVDVFKSGVASGDALARESLLENWRQSPAAAEPAATLDSLAAGIPLEKMAAAYPDLDPGLVWPHEPRARARTCVMVRPKIAFICIVDCDA